MTHTTDDGSVEYAVEQAWEFAWLDGHDLPHAQNALRSTREWLNVAMTRMTGGAYRSNAEAARIAVEAMSQVKGPNPNVDLRAYWQRRALESEAALVRIANLTNSVSNAPRPQTIAHQALLKEQGADTEPVASTIMREALREIAKQPTNSTRPAVPRGFICTQFLRDAATAFVQRDLTAEQVAESMEAICDIADDDSIGRKPGEASNGTETEATDGIAAADAGMAGRPVGADWDDAVGMADPTPPSEDGERVLLWHAQLGYWLGAEKHGPGFTQDYREAVSFTRAYAETQIEGAGDDLPGLLRIATLDGGIEHDGGVCSVRADMLVVVDYDGFANLDDLEPKEAWRWAWVGADRFRPAPPTDERALTERERQVAERAFCRGALWVASKTDDPSRVLKGIESAWTRAANAPDGGEEGR